MKRGWEEDDALFSEAKTEQRLWEYIDGIGTVQERATTENLLTTRLAWRAKYNELLAVHQLMNEVETEQPSMRFARNVMEAIGQHHIAPATRNYINKKVIWVIAAFFITAIGGFLMYAFSQAAPAPNVAGTGFEDADFSRVNYSRVFNSNFVNSFMMLNILLGLMLLDRYLAQQKKFKV